MSEDTRAYPSKVDAWIAIVLGLGPVFATFGGAVTVLAGQSPWIAIAPIAVFVLVYGGLVFPMNYTITADELVVRSGLVRIRIPLAEIVEVSPTRNPLSSPALSLDRLRVRSEARTIMISPRERSAFLTELAVAARLRTEGDRLVR